MAFVLFGGFDAGVDYATELDVLIEEGIDLRNWEHLALFDDPQPYLRFV